MSRSDKKILFALRNNKLIPILACLLAGLIFFILSTVRLDSQGLYYDELFQATSSFAYVGQPPYQFSSLVVKGIPIMNLDYIGAIKTAIYGLFLRFSGQTFGVESWRLVGIIFVGFAIILFGLIVRKKFSLLGLLTFFFLVLTDITVILTTRFDWGPVALALFLRLLLIGVWLKGELADNIPAWNSFWIGAVFGISIFEKLSAIVLAIPVLLMVLLSPKRRNMRHLSALVVGGIIGLAPLILANLYTFSRRGYFISFQSQYLIYQRTYSFHEFLGYVNDYLSLGAGRQVQLFILGISQNALSLVETALLVSILLSVMIALIVNAHLVSVYFHLSAIMLLAYFSIMVSLYFLPAPSWVHHWVIGTPFQYAAIVLFISGLFENIPIIKINLYKSIFAILFGIMIISRLTGLSLLEQAFSRGDASAKWDPSLTGIGKFAASQSGRAIFIAGDWGIANQMISFLNGKPGIVYEIFLDDHRNIDRILDVFRNSQEPEVYLVFHNPPYFAKTEVRELLLEEIELSLKPEWRKQPIERQIDGLRSVEVYKYSKESP